MAKEITLVQVHKIELDETLVNLSQQELFTYLNGCYDFHGKNIALFGDYQHTILSEIDDVEVYIEDGVVGLNGSQIILTNHKKIVS